LPAANAAHIRESAAGEFRQIEKGATMKAIGAVGKACGNCHDNFRDK
jgi:cytochrome c556